jgi:hypothetical protein
MVRHARLFRRLPYTDCDAGRVVASSPAAHSLDRQRPAHSAGIFSRRKQPSTPACGIRKSLRSSPGGSLAIRANSAAPPLRSPPGCGPRVTWPRAGRGARPVTDRGGVRSDATLAPWRSSARLAPTAKSGCHAPCTRRPPCHDRRICAHIHVWRRPTGNKRLP